MMNPEWGRGGRLPWPTRAQFEGWNAGLSGEESIPARWAESKQYARAFAAGQEHRASMTAEEVHEMETRDE